MNRQFLFILIFLFPFSLCAQFISNIWVFGDSAGINFNNAPAPIITSIDSRGSSASISDSLGNLLFYVCDSPDALNGGIDKPSKIYNKDFQLMMYGDSIIGDAWYKEYVILNFPDSENLFYEITAGVTINSGLYYSIIDMDLDSGRGAVVQKNIQLKDSDFWCNDGLAAIKHGNGRDWWLIARNWQFYTDTFYLYLVTPTGINLDHIQKAGDIVQSGFFRIEPSKDGSKIACLTNKGLMSVYDFNRCNGYLSNQISIQHETTDPNFFPWYWDCEISPNNRFLYVSKPAVDNMSSTYLLQFDLLASNVAASRDTIYSAPLPVVGGLIELAPDNKMYWSCAYNPPFTFMYPYPDSVYNNINMNLSVINEPDSLGTACSFQPFSFNLGGKRTYYGLPNNPDYDMKPLYGSVCDSLSAGINDLQPITCKLFVSYVSPWQKAFINAQNLKGTTYTLTVIDIAGKLVFKEKGRLRPPYFTRDLDCGAFANGMYIVTLTTNKEKVAQKFIKN
ncbi:MAG: T9SS type A sorting domain-containing protein [Bacteroidia bacterium]